MFYLIEIKKKINYVIFTYIVLIYLFVLFKDNLFIIISCPLLEVYGFIFFFYSSAFELGLTYFFLVNTFSLFFLFIFCGWQILVYMLPAFTCSQMYSLFFYYLVFIILILMYNIIYIGFLLPNMWLVFDQLNAFLSSSQLIPLFLELKLQEYFSFIFKHLLLFNFIYLFLIFSFFFFFKNWKVQFLNSKIKWYFFLASLLLILFIDISSLIISLISFIILLEFILFFIIINQKIILYNFKIYAKI